jgi:hypothetical protein
MLYTPTPAHRSTSQLRLNYYNMELKVCQGLAHEIPFVARIAANCSTTSTPLTNYTNFHFNHLLYKKIKPKLLWWVSTISLRLWAFATVCFD